jgi:hypothetical protein
MKLILFSNKVINNNLEDNFVFMSGLSAKYRSANYFFNYSRTVDNDIGFSLLFYTYFY